MGRKPRMRRTQEGKCQIVSEDVQIADGWAIEVDNSEATFKISAMHNPVSVQDEGMRVLKRQSDGSW
jgi:hypothetical protein